MLSPSVGNGRPATRPDGYEVFRHVRLIASFAIVLLLSALVAVTPLANALAGDQATQALLVRALAMAVFVSGAVFGSAAVLGWRRTTGPPLALGALEGVAATVLRRGRAQFLLRVIGFVAAGLGCLAGAALAGGGGRGWWAAGFAIVGAWFIGYVAPVLAGRYTAGGLWLTPLQVIHEAYGVHVSVPWDAIEEACVRLTVRDLVFITRPGRVAERAPVAWIWHDPWPVTRDSATLTTEGLGLDAWTLMLVAEHYREHPEARPELGTPAGLARIESICREATEAI